MEAVVLHFEDQVNLIAFALIEDIPIKDIDYLVSLIVSRRWVRWLKWRVRLDEKNAIKLLHFVASN